MYAIVLIIPLGNDRQVLCEGPDCPTPTGGNHRTVDREIDREQNPGIHDTSPCASEQGASRAPPGTQPLAFLGRRVLLGAPLLKRVIHDPVSAEGGELGGR